MDGYSISQVAERTGFPPSTLRFYDQHGLVRPARTASGYRSYDDGHVELLEFIGRAKGFGLSLEEIADLVPLRDEDRCAPVQTRLRELVDAKIADAQGHIAELVVFTGELQQVAARLNGPTPDGPCDDTCGCTSDAPAPTGVALTAKPDAGSAAPIACTLSPDHVGARIGEWRSLLATAQHREPTPSGVELRFTRDADIASIAALAAAEQECCEFLTFTIDVDRDAVTLTVTAHDDARPLADALFGVGS